MTIESKAIAIPATDDSAPGSAPGSAMGAGGGSFLRTGLAVGAAAVVALGLGLAPVPAAAQSANQDTAAQQGQQGQQIDIPDAKRAKIERLLDLTRVDSTVETIKPLAAKQMNAMLEKRAPDMGQAKRKQLLKSVSTTFDAGRDELTQALVPVYAKTFTEEELDRLVAFYDTPEGQAIAQKMPQAVGMARQISRQWSQQMAQQAFMEVKKNAEDLGYKL